MIPSEILIIRSVCWPTPGSWVTMTVVIPSLRFSSFRTAMTSFDVWLSSAPVGSSARIIDGFVISARAIATLCFCPPDNSPGRWCARSRQSHPVKLFHGQLVALFPAYALVEQRKSHVLNSIFIIDQVKRLEHKSD